MSGKKSRQRGAKNNQADYKKDPTSADRKDEYAIDPTANIPIVPGYNSQRPIGETDIGSYEQREIGNGNSATCLLYWVKSLKLPAPKASGQKEKNYAPDLEKWIDSLTPSNPENIGTGCIGNCFNRKPYIEE